MIFRVLSIGNIRHPETYQELEKNQVWAKAFEWLRENVGKFPESLAPIELHGQTLRALPQLVNLKSRDEQVAERGFEAHRREVDLQICIEGSERIEWLPLAAVESNVEKEYDSEKDFALYVAPQKAGGIVLMPGDFVIFFPEHAHLPGIRWVDLQTKKFVIKADLDLLAHGLTS